MSDLSHNISIDISSFEKSGEEVRCFFSEPNVFKSKLWFDAWVQTISNHCESYLVRVTQQNKLCGFFFLCLVNERRRLFFQRRILFLNEFPRHGFDMTVELNGFLMPDELDKKILYKEILAYLGEYLEWDELQFRLLEWEDACAVRALPSSLEFWIEVEKQDVDRVAVLSPCKSWSQNELSLYSKNKRYQIRRAKKAYEDRYGAVLVSQADSLDCALAWFELLGDMHTKYWNLKGKRGAFAEPRWVEFHENIIRSGFSEGSIQILHIRSGGESIGYIYNLLHHGKVYNIQSGFLYEMENKFKPGFLSHYLAMKHCHDLGVSEYHFLAGGEGYKKSLSNEFRELVSLSIRRKTISLYLENSLLAVVRFVRKFK